MACENDVITLHKSDPTLTSGQIAKRLNCMPSYVIATFHRNGLKLPHAGRVVSPLDRQKEYCAKIAEEMGSKEIADAIRRRA